MSPDSGKMKGSFPRWTAGAAFVVLGLGCISYKHYKEAQKPRRMIPPPSDHMLTLMEHEEAEGSHSLEDALARLEGRGHPGRSHAPSVQEESKSRHYPHRSGYGSDVELDEDESKAREIVTGLFEKLFAPDAQSGAAESGRSRKKRESAREADKRSAREAIKETVRELEEQSKAHQEENEVDELDVEDELSEEMLKQLEEEAALHDKYHQDFADLVKKEAEHKLEFNLSIVKKEFHELFGKEAPHLLCQGCKLVAERLTSELAQHDVDEQEYPVLMFKQKRRAMDATCSSFKYLQVVSEAGSHRFEAVDLSGKEAPSLHGQRLCQSLLEDAKFDLLSKLIQKKVPSYSLFSARNEAPENWERFLCAQHSRVCKRSQVREDDEDNGEEL
mmetsp:Transcript_11369/g.26244  ORF Transcript_11369/g.26244 Transcript_11369/m.26244 type:complete len:388 (+) Transcript_11369:100-1263(+)